MNSRVDGCREACAQHPVRDRGWGALAAAVATVALQGTGLAGELPDVSTPFLVDATEASGIRFVHRFGDGRMSNIVESSGSGCAFFDYDGDGRVDLYAVNCAYRPGVNEGDPEPVEGNRLFRNLGDGRFEDVTERVGCGDKGYGMGCAVGDVDNDGHADLYVANAGRNVLYRNGGGGRFRDFTESAGVADSLLGIGAAFLDYDLDGDLDLYVANYLDYDPEYRLYYAADEFPGPLAYAGQRDVLYRNEGDGTFVDVTEPAGVSNEGRAMGVVTADVDDDGWTDLFVANDAMANFLYRNNGNGTFTDTAVEAGLAFSASGDATSAMGGDFGDYDNDGDVDLLVPDMTFSNLYVNRGGGLFEDVTAASGLAEACGQFVSWGGDFGDFNNDGFLDIVLSNGDAHRLDTMESLLLLNVPGPDGRRVFRDLSGRCGPWLRQKAVSRGMATGDFDNDGDLDLFVVNLDQPSRLVRNDLGSGMHWLSLDLKGGKSNRDGVGAQVRLRDGEWTRLEEKRTASSYLSQNDPRIHVGLGERRRVDEIEIRWPSGRRQVLRQVEADQVLRVEEP